MINNNGVKSRSKLYLALCLGLGTLVGVWWLAKNEKIYAITKKEKVVRPVVYTESAARRAKVLTALSPEKSNEAKEAMKFFRSYMDDPAFSTFFAHALDFFGEQKAAYPAARFVALSLLFDESPENFYMQKWTRKELQDNSEAIMSTLESKEKLIDDNPFFHSRMLNLVHQLEITPERKLSFYSATLERPLELNSKGELEDNSLAFETALYLAQQASAPPDDMASIIKRVLSKNTREDQTTAVRERVLTYYPALAYLFKDDIEEN